MKEYKLDIKRNFTDNLNIKGAAPTIELKYYILDIEFFNILLPLGLWMSCLLRTFLGCKKKLD